ncbi:methyltransferase domain-containing protein [Thermodesulfobacteriota bacterium]
MAVNKETLKKMLPFRLDELLVFFLKSQEKARRNKRIAQKNRRKIETLLKSEIPIKLELGAGTNRGIAGWTYADVNENCDLILNLEAPIPFPDNSVSEIYSSHLLEHFHYHSLVNFLKECLRILKPGGLFNAAVPNAKIYMEAYQHPEAFDADTFCQYKPAFNYNSKIDYVNYIAYMDGQHKYMFDEDNIVAILKKNSFKDVKLRKFDKILDFQSRDIQSIYVLGKK